MPVIAAYLYRNGVRVREVALDEKVDCEEDKTEFVWIGVADPTEDELRQLQDHYGLHPLAVEDAQRGDQLPKIDVYNDQLFVVARTATLENDEIQYGSTSIFVGHSHIISVRHGSTRAYKELRAHLEEAPAQLRHGVDYILHAILDYIVDGYLPIVQTIEDEVLGMEQQAIDSFLDRAQINHIFKFRRELIRFQRIISPMAEVAGKIVKLDLPCIDAEARPYFSDVYDHARRVAALVDGLREVLNSVFEFSNLLEQQRTGAITRQLAAWAAILAVPTAIAGIYGMNFDHMPELRWAYGYPTVIAVIAVVCVGLYIRFKRANWL